MSNFNERGMASIQRAAISTRFSCDFSRKESIEDQKRNCYDYATQHGWVVLEEYVRADEAKTGRTRHNRDGLNSLLESARQVPRPFDVLIVDEASRLARKLKDILDIADDLKFNGVKLVLVNLKLESDNPSFQTLLTMHGLVDEQNSERSRERVLRGQKGRVLQGYSSGSLGFGYRSVKIKRPEVLDAKCHADYLGSRWEPIPEQAATVTRIMEMFADGGLSMHQIVLRLNAEGVPAARKPRIGPDRTVWNANLVKKLLQNPKYIGQIVWGKTHQLIDPRTGKTVTRKNPESEWVKVEAPHLRIVADDLWNRVQARLQVVNEEFKAHRIGGLNRAKRKDYLFSGLLECGVCGSSLIIGGSGGVAENTARYVCVSYRYKRGCTNSINFREDRLAAQLVHALATDLLIPENMNYLVQAVSDELNAYLQGAVSDRESSHTALIKRTADLEAGIRKIMDYMVDPANSFSPALGQRLASMEADLKQAKVDLALVSIPKEIAGAQYDLRKLVSENVDNLVDALKQDVPKARQVLQRHVKRLRLIPTETPNGPGYYVLGEIDLFKQAGNPGKGVLLDRSYIQTIQQYTDHLFRFFGNILYVRGGVTENPLNRPLAALFRARPELLHTPLTAKQWAKHLKTLNPEDLEFLDRIDAHILIKDFENGSEVLCASFGMTSFVYCRVQYFMFSRSDGTDYQQQAASDLPIAA